MTIFNSYVCLPEGILELRKKCELKRTGFWPQHFLAKECIRKSYGKQNEEPAVCWDEHPRGSCSSALQFRLSKPRGVQIVQRWQHCVGAYGSNQNKPVDTRGPSPSSSQSMTECCALTIWIVGSSFFSMDRFKGKFTGKPHDLNGKIYGFRFRFSLQPIHWFLSVFMFLIIPFSTWIVPCRYDLASRRSFHGNQSLNAWTASSCKLLDFLLLNWIWIWCAPKIRIFLDVPSHTQAFRWKL